MGTLDGQVAFVTGAGRGIGRAAAMALADAGAAVALVARTEWQVGEAAAAIEQRGGCALPLVADVCDLAAVRHAVKKAEGQLGPITFLTHCGCCATSLDLPAGPGSCWWAHTAMSKWTDVIPWRKLWPSCSMRRARIPLEGWSFEETAAYLSGLAVQPLPQAFVRYIHQEAGGSPFYTREVFRHLVEERTIVNDEGRWSTDADLRAAGVRRGVREVVGRRVGRLSEATQRLLQHGAAFTGGFPFGLLPALTDLDEPTLLDSLDEALDAGLIRAAASHADTYAFAHAIVRHTLYDELSPSRQARLHRRIAETLEVLQATPGGHVEAEIAAQYHASASLPGAERGVAYALRAAEQTRAAYAPEQAVGLLRLARDLVGQSGPASRADVLQRLARATRARRDTPPPDASCR